MKLNSHLLKTKERVLASLNYEKKELIESYSKILSETIQLFLKYNSQNQSLAFWLKQINNTSWDEIPITKTAITEIERIWRNYIPKQNSISHKLSDSAEILLTFWVENELCELQGQFYHYFCTKNKKVFAESTLGNLKCLNSLDGFPIKMFETKRSKKELVN